jgi:hypothetical protein
MSEHFLLAASDDTDRWVILHRDYADRWDVFSTARASLEGMVNFLIETLQKHPGADVTFSTRPVAQVRADLIEDAAAVRTAVSGASLHIMARAGTYIGSRGEVIAYAPNLWGTAWRDPRGGLSAGHRNTRFREQVLLEIIRNWFVAQNYESFRLEPLRQRGDLQRVPRPGFDRELFVRHEWRSWPRPPPQRSKPNNDDELHRAYANTLAANTTLVCLIDLIHGLAGDTRGHRPGVGIPVLNATTDAARVCISAPSALARGQSIGSVGRLRKAASERGGHRRWGG